MEYSDPVRYFSEHLAIPLANQESETRPQIYRQMLARIWLNLTGKSGYHNHCSPYLISYNTFIISDMDSQFGAWIFKRIDRSIVYLRWGPGNEQDSRLPVRREILTYAADFCLNSVATAPDMSISFRNRWAIRWVVV